MSKFIAYINDNKIQIKSNNIVEFSSNGIDNGNIINKEVFIKDYKTNIRINNIFANEIDILLNKDINEIDKIYYNYVFEDLNYNKINIYNTKKYLDNNSLIINKDYYIILHNNNYYYIYPYLLYEFLNIKNINKVKVIGNKIIKDNNNCRFYYYNNFNNYFLRED